MTSDSLPRPPHNPTHTHPPCSYFAMTSYATALGTLATAAHQVAMQASG